MPLPHWEDADTEAAVIGIPHDELGEDVGATIALARVATAGSDELRELVKAWVAAYEYPRRIWLVDAVPRARPARL